MPYTINRYNGAQVSVVADGTVDSTLDIKIIGKNYAGYGEIQNENLIFMLENFAGSVQPPKAISGQVWYDSGNKKLKFFDGTKFRTAGGAEVGSEQPTNPALGDFFFNTTTKQLYVWNGSTPTLVGPQAVQGAQTTEMISRSVTDSVGGTHPIIEAQINGATIYTISQDATFQLDNTINAITGFTKIHPGITMAYTQLEGEATLGVSQGAYRFFGSATNAEKLGGVDATSFVRSDVTPSFATQANFADVGYTVGLPTKKLYVFVDGDGVPTIQANYNTLVFQTKSGQTYTPLKMVGPDMLPGANNATDIGSTGLRYKTIYAGQFNGVATQADTVTVAGVARSASTASSENTVAIRDGNRDLYARYFQGTATSAQYADLAEKYLADAEYEVGTVVSVGGSKEVTACKYGDRALGTVSENPAFKMNEGLEGGTYIALKGRVPVKVIGAVRKGQRLIASNDGTAVAAVPHANDVFAIALESSDDTGVKLVEAVIL
jgi:hypothetical protein